MKTEEMIAALAADTGRAAPPLRTIAIATGVGVLGAAAVFLVGFGARPDFALAMQRADFLFKFFVTLAVAVPALVLLGRMARPGREARTRLLAIGPTVLAAGVVIELAITPASQWPAHMIGSNAVLCLTTIPLLSLVPFLCLFYAMRAGAPTRPGLAGAVCGLTAAGIGATLYAAHCTDDSPLFVALWYSLAVASVTLIGALAGRRWLRW